MSCVGQKHRPRGRSGRPDVVTQACAAAFGAAPRPGLPTVKRVAAFARVVQREMQGPKCSQEELAAHVFLVLDGRTTNGRGLLNDFDRTKYCGRLTTDDHFMNLFAGRLRSRLANAAESATDGGRRGDPDRFLHRPGGGWYSVRAVAQHGSPVHSKDIDNLPDRPRQARHGLESLTDYVWEALDALAPVDDRILWMCIGCECSDRDVGREVGVCHKTVARRVKAALAKFRTFFANELAAVGNENIEGTPQTDTLADRCTLSTRECADGARSHRRQAGALPTPQHAGRTTHGKV